VVVIPLFIEEFDRDDLSEAGRRSTDNEDREFERWAFSIVSFDVANSS
jgi:hypothetical protein